MQKGTLMLLKENFHYIRQTLQTVATNSITSLRKTTMFNDIMPKINLSSRKKPINPQTLWNR